MKVLVIGAAGRLGSVVVRQLDELAPVTPTGWRTSAISPILRPMSLCIATFLIHTR